MFSNLLSFPAEETRKSWRGETEFVIIYPSRSSIEVMSSVGEKTYSKKSGPGVKVTRHGGSQGHRSSLSIKSDCLPLHHAELPGFFRGTYESAFRIIRIVVVKYLVS